MSPALPVSAGRPFRRNAPERKPDGKPPDGRCLWNLTVPWHFLKKPFLKKPFLKKPFLKKPFLKKPAARRAAPGMLREWVWGRMPGQRAGFDPQLSPVPQKLCHQPTDPAKWMFHRHVRPVEAHASGAFAQPSAPFPAQQPKA